MFKRENLNRAQARAQPNQARPLALVVDDEAANLQAIGAALEDIVRIVPCHSAAEALDWVQANPSARPSVVICDYRMPETDGVSLLARLKQELPDTRRILLTGYVDIDAVIDSINRAGIWRFMVKPWDREDLRLTVQRALEAFELKHRLDAHHEQLERTVAERTRELAERNAELKAALEELHQVSRTDPLTGLRNRRYLEDTIGADMALARRRADAPQSAPHSDLVFFLVDIDRFKPINDRLGHAAGDRLLREFAGRLVSCSRESDVVMRWGGEEFLVLARFVDRASADGMAERICRAVAETPFGQPGEQETMACSVGFAAWPQGTADGPEEWSSIVELADQCMYLAKSAGGNQWCGIRADCLRDVESLRESLLRARSGDDPALDAMLWRPDDVSPEGGSGAVHA